MYYPFRFLLFDTVVFLDTIYYTIVYKNQRKGNNITAPGKCWNTNRGPNPEPHE